jgi:hypothetical protein
LPPQSSPLEPGYLDMVKKSEFPGFICCKLGLPSKSILAQWSLRPSIPRRVLCAIYAAVAVFGNTPHPKVKRPSTATDPDRFTGCCDAPLYTPLLYKLNDGRY